MQISTLSTTKVYNHSLVSTGMIGFRTTPTNSTIHAYQSLLLDGVVFVYNLCTSVSYFKSFLDYLQYLVQCELYVNNCYTV